MIQIIEEDTEENKKVILIELQNLTNDINIKEIENILQNSIAELSNINKREKIKLMGARSKEEGKNQVLNRIWNTRLSRAFWLEGLRIGEYKNSIIRFYPSRYTICYQ